MIEKIVIQQNGLSWSLTPEEFERVGPSIRDVTSVTIHEKITLDELQKRLDKQSGYAWRIYDKTAPERRTGFMSFTSEAEAVRLFNYLQKVCICDMSDYGLRKEKD